MLKSMTGFGRSEEIIGGRDITVEIRSLNHRYYEFSSRIPRNMGFLEERLKTALGGRISRGKTEVSVSIVNVGESDKIIGVNIPIAKGYLNALRKANEELGLTDDLTLSQAARFPDVITVTGAQPDEEELWNDVKKVTLDALDKFIAMRETEGEKMKADLSSRIEYIEELLDIIEERSPQVNEAYRQKLYARLEEILGDRQIDEARVLTEAAIFADKTAVDEETVRLRSHIAQFCSLLELEEPVGRKLDFLIQEFNREINTIGSKCQDAEITKTVVELKSEIEKIREQIQNIE